MDRLKVATELLAVAKVLIGQSAEARELYLHIRNNGALTRSMFVPTVKNLNRKVSRGNYNTTLASKAFMYLADEGAKDYVKEYGSDENWSDMFPKNVRKNVAEELRDYYEAEFKGKEV